jgi:hypothetical protein
LIPKTWIKVSSDSPYMQEYIEMFSSDLEGDENVTLYLDKEYPLNGAFISEIRMPLSYENYTTAQVVEKSSMAGMVGPAEINGKQFYITGHPIGFDGVVGGAFIVHDKTFYSFIAFATGESADYVEQIIQSIRLK